MNYSQSLRPILLLFVFTFAATLALAQSNDDRPTLKHQTAPMQQETAPEAPAPAAPGAKKTTVLVDGVNLPMSGHAWALDRVGTTQELAHLKFSGTHLNNHRGENIAKSVAAPLVFRQKATVEIAGAAAKVRLHDSEPVFYLRSIYSVDDMNTDDDQYAEPHLNLIRMHVEGDHRIANTINFGRVTLKAKRSEDVIETRLERLGATGWFKLTPLQPLTPGEYGLVPLPKTQNTFSTVVLDFAIDPHAPENRDVVPAMPAKN